MGGYSRWTDGDDPWDIPWTCGDCKFTENMGIGWRLTQIIHSQFFPNRSFSLFLGMVFMADKDSFAIFPQQKLPPSVKATPRSRKKNLSI